MLESERTFKIKVRSRWKVRDFLFMSAVSLVFFFKVFCMKKRLPNIFKTKNFTKLTKAILKSSYRVLEVTSKSKTPKQLSTL